MGVCLKAVSHFFEGKKNFKSLVIYLRLALKIFVCVGVEGSRTILGGRSMSEFVIYFLMKSLDSEQPTLDRDEFITFLNIIHESLQYHTHQIEFLEKMILENHANLNQISINNLIQQDKQIILDTLDTLALFTLQFNVQNKGLFEILKSQIEPLKTSAPRPKRAATIEVTDAEEGGTRPLGRNPSSGQVDQEGLLRPPTDMGA
jgi:hypothetical protein